MNTDVFGSVTAGSCRCSTSCREQILNVKLSGEIDQAGALYVYLLDRPGSGKLSATDDDAGLFGCQLYGLKRIGLVMGRYRLMQTMGGELLVTGASPRIQRLMQMGGLDKLPIFGKNPGSKPPRQQ